MSSSIKTYLTTLRARNFRNLRDTTLNFGPEINLIIGDNGQGKTNCLEAIALSCSLRPMQSLGNQDLIENAYPASHLHASFLGDNISEITIDILPRGKKAQLNHKTLKNAHQLSTVTPIVSFIPSELNLLCGSASLRRRAVDQATISLYPEHYLALKTYDKVLKHRNKLLKSWPLDQLSLAIFTDMLLSESAKLIANRLKALSDLAPIYQTRLSLILGYQCQAELIYHLKSQPLTTTQTSTDLNDHLRRLSHRYQALELVRKTTLFGPHLDDIVFKLDGLDSHTASRGQTRAIVLAFKLATMIAINQLRNHCPIIILDDIISELDKHKKNNLINLISELNTQAFFSATDSALFSLKTAFTLSYIRQGECTSSAIG